MGSAAAVEPSTEVMPARGRSSWPSPGLAVEGGEPLDAVTVILEPPAFSVVIPAG